MSAATVEHVPAEVVMSRADAKRLTGDIKRRLGDIEQRSERLAEAIHRARAEGAWKALDYGSWDLYVAGEFPDLSRGQEYRLSKWGQVVAELEAAAGAPVDVTGREAAEVATTSSEVADAIRAGLEAMPDAPVEERQRVAKDALDKAVAESKAARARAKPEPEQRAAATRPPGTPSTPPQSLEAATDTDAADEAERPPAATWDADPADLVVSLLGTDPMAAAHVPVEDLDALLSWIGRVRAAKRATKVPEPTRAAPPKPQPPAEAKAPRRRPASSSCKHPPNRKLGKACMECGDPDAW